MAPVQHAEGRIASARQVFDGMPELDTVAWNTMLTSYSRLGLHQEAIALFTQLRFSDAKPDDYSFTAILSTCASLGNVKFGRKIQSLVIRSGFCASLPVNNSLIDMYGKCSDTLSANKVFRDMCCDSRNEVTWCSLLFAYMNAEQFEAALDVFVEMPKRVAFAWNIMISGHAHCGKLESCLSLFKEMLESEFKPDCYTFSSLMNACSADSSNVVYGRMVHAVMLKNGWSSAVEAKNSVLSFYTKLGSRDDAMRELESIEVLTQVSWNSIIDACMKIGETEKALEVFHLAPEKNIVTWTTMITGYGRNGDGEQALRFFVEMMKSGVDSDHFAYGAVLHACSGLALLGHGKMIHGCLIHCGFQGYAYVGNALVNLYAKCGDIKEADRAFGDIANKDLVSWNTMLFAFGVHGLADQALKLYDNMIASGIKPDNVTFIGLLTTCSHSGLVEEGCMIFESMVKDYRIPLEVDHVTCMIDMFGRGGHLAEAKDLATTYSSLVTDSSNNSSWETLLGACSTHWHTELGREVSKVLKIAEPSEEMSFVLLSNLYCSTGRWKEGEDVRREMVERGMKKTPGCSWIEVGNQVSTFVVGDSSHPRLEELSETLNCLQHEMRNPETFGP
ncbi:Tetratricopeptide repeat (TPR)-like superfamily protein [Arabidopsis thaliana]|uniref:Tetratricopeptide repeat (TPR)-like superfamily protein n=1 Tax=Arabidopsis thaliana TaxID=3702 RepID=A0A1P8AY85_ARATH|nr:Tetratricopeptide repeat (TPR)-like superfamily protein [Arabidopsis thaliana]ANM61618.1 Tetratricopeptide repeat (TPR)-like superfamily protein [Arabidopsis thaliana]|eukprot:NP_001323824.1 Tetratricopeptide repeat (TPR)-like superfamily protein [Arabidopsis thaliana]